MEPRRTPHSNGSPGRRSPGVEAQIALGVTLLAAAIAALAGCHPTGSPIDPAVTAAFAGSVTLAASRAKRWSLLPLIGVAVPLSQGWVLVPALGAAAAAIGSARTTRRSRALGAAVGGLAVNALLRLPDIGFHGLPSLLVAAAVAPVLVSGYQSARRRERRVVRRVGVGLAVAVGLVGVAYVALLGSAYGDLDDGAIAARAGLSATRSGDTEAASEAFARSESAFGRADARLGAWWAAPAQAIPVLGQHARAVATAADVGQDLADTAGNAVAAADYDELRSVGGQFDLDRIAATEEPLRRTEAAITSAQRQIADDRSPWLVGPLGEALDDLAGELDRAGGEATLARDAVEVAPALLGGDGPRRYLVVFVTPVELRGSGGFVGSFAELTVDQGRLDLARTGSSTQLQTDDRDLVQLEGLDEYEERYGAYAVGSDFRDLTFSPHFPYDADAIRQAYPQLGGAPVDGVISLDPIALAALLEITGPIESPAFGRTLTADDAADFLLRDNYSQFADPEAQNDALAQLVELTFDQLTTGDLPGPRQVADVLGPVTRAGRIRLWSPDDAEEALFERIGADGALPAARPDRDFLAVASQNSGNNKLDLYQRRSIDYRVSVDDGALRATATVTVRNEVPLDAGLPEYVTGNNQGDPLGTNRMLLTVYSPHLLEEALLDGAEVGVLPQREAGYRAYTVEVVVPPGGQVVLELELSGTLDIEDGYVLDLVPQPLVVSDELALQVTLGEGGETEREGVPIEGRRRIRIDR